MRKDYTSADLHANYQKKEIPVALFSPSKSTVDKLLAFSAAYWTSPICEGKNVELILN
jgi:hypothetical protein